CTCFFFQAEDGIRDYKVTGVQTCALPISAVPVPTDSFVCVRMKQSKLSVGTGTAALRSPTIVASGLTASMSSTSLLSTPTPKRRSEERRVGKECRSRRWTEHDKREVNEDM